MTADVDLATLVHQRVIRDERADVVAAAGDHVSALAPLLPTRERQVVIADVLQRVSGLGPLEELLADPEVTDVLVNSGTELWVDRRQGLERVGTLPDGLADQLVERILAPLGLHLDRACPIVDARLPDGSRLNAVIPPLAVDGTLVAIRRFAVHQLPLDEVAGVHCGQLLRTLVRGRANLVVSGATAAGKTTLLNSLAVEIGAHERIITIEDTAELALAAPHVVRLEARPPTAEGIGGATIRDLVRTALRMRPDRLVIGEVRGGEALDMVQAMNTGHDGSLTTCHANSPADALRRIESMVLQGGGTLPLAAVREQVHAALDAVVHLARGADGRRRVVAVAEVCPDPDDPARARLLADPDGTLAPPTRLRRP